MANSYQLHTTTTATTGPFSFAQIDGYLSVSHLSVLVNGSVVSGSTYTINSTTKEVTFNSAIGAGSTVRIVRITPKTVSGRFVDFQNAAVLTADDLDNSALQNLYISQEAEDAGSSALQPSSDGLAWDAKNKRIINVASPTANSDAATKNYVDSAIQGIDVGMFSNPQAWEFTGNGTNSYLWTSNGQGLPSSTEAKTFIIEVGGVIQHPVTNYTITPTALVFTGNVSNGVTIRARNFGIAATLPQWDSTTTFTQPTTFSSTVNIGNSGQIQFGSSRLSIRQGLDNPAGNPNGSLYIGNGGSSAVAPTAGSFNNNTAIGLGSGYSITSGRLNTAVGANALSLVTTASNNVAIGSDAGSGLTTGNQNVLIGNVTPSNAASLSNTIVGHGAGPVNPDYLVNSIAVGAFAVPNGSNTTVIGNTQTTSSKLFGNLITTGTGTSPIGGALEVAGNITLKTGATGSISGSLLPTGSILQIVSAQSTAGITTSNNGASFLDTTLTANITPTKASSKIFIIVNGPVSLTRDSGNASHKASLRVNRGVNTAVTFDSCISLAALAATGTSGYTTHQFCGIHLDSPATTSQLTYTVQLSATSSVTGNACTIAFPSSSVGQRSVMYLIEIA